MRDYGVGSLSGVVLLSLSLVHELFAMSQPFGSDPDFHNPFSAPATAASGVQPQYSQRPASKPTTATAFGILNLVFGAMALVGLAIGIVSMVFLRKQVEQFTKQAMPEPSVFYWIGVAISLALSVWLIYSGIKVLSGTMAGRASFMAYCVGSLLIRPFLIAINLFAQSDQLQQQFAAQGQQMPPGALVGILAFGGLVGLVFAEAYEAIGFFVMKSQGVRQQFEAWDNVVNSGKSNQSFNFQ